MTSHKYKFPEKTMANTRGPCQYMYALSCFIICTHVLGTCINSVIIIGIALVLVMQVINSVKDNHSRAVLISE